MVVHMGLTKGSSPVRSFTLETLRLLHCGVLCWGEQEVRSNAAPCVELAIVTVVVHQPWPMVHQSSLRSLSILFTCLLIWTHLFLNGTLSLQWVLV